MSGPVPTVSVCFHAGKFTMPEGYDPPEDRFTSTPGDNLVELSGRVCYDSIDRKRKGRPSVAYHTHLLDTKHHSVHAHHVLTFQVKTLLSPGGSLGDHVAILRVLSVLQCRPGVWVTEINETGVRFAASLRAVIEWDDHGPQYKLNSVAVEDTYRDLSASLHAAVVDLIRQDFPLCLNKTRPRKMPLPHGTSVSRVEPKYPTEEWVGLYFAGVSRDLLQELVRHHWQANPSVRSTRYVDEGDSFQVPHPAMDAADRMSGVRNIADGIYSQCRAAYKEVFRKLRDAGADEKTARGAARSLLPGATETKMVYSLSRFQAKHTLSLRLTQSTGLADPEIVRLSHAVQDVLCADPVNWDV